MPLRMENNALTGSRVYRDHTMKMQWSASGDIDDVYNGTDDVVSIYRYDTPTFEGFHAKDHLPPKDHFLTACSVDMWMKKDEEATKTVSITPSKTGELIGSAKVGNLNETTASFFTVVVARGDNFASSYQVLVINSSDHVAPLLSLLVSFILSVVFVALSSH